MAEQQRSYLIGKFKDGEIPTGQDFADMIDSSLNLLDDGLTRYKISDIHGVHKRFGIGDTAPECPLGIKGETGHDDEMICFTSANGLHKWNLNLNPTVSDTPGFSIDDASSGTSTSRFFIDSSTIGKVGLGTVTPAEKLHLQGAADGDMLSIQIQNTSTGHSGYLLSHIDDNSILERAGAFGIVEKDGVDEIERMTFLKKLGTTPNFYTNVGINEKLPFATLHVTRIDVNSDVRLAENTGMLLLGPIDSLNLAMDGHSIQAREGDYVEEGPTLAFTVSQLDLQPLGGTIYVHSNYTTDKQVIVTDVGLVGLGVTPTERLAINGAAIFGDTETEEPTEGTVRWHIDPATGHGDLEVFKDDEWTSLTTTTVTDGFWTEGEVDGSIYYEPVAGNAKVGIGVTTPTAALHVLENNTGFSGNCIASNIGVSGSTELTDMAIFRTALRLATSGPFSSNGAMYNMGLYVQGVVGQTNANANLGAVINGSVVVGNLTGQALVGTSGTNVLAIQNGVSPTTTAGTTMNAGIQLFSSVVVNDDGEDVSTFNLMNGDGTTIQLFVQPALPDEDFNEPHTLDVNTDLLIKNLRSRIDALELTLQNLGLIL